VAQAYDHADRQALQDTVCLSTGQTAPQIPSGITVTINGSPETTGDTSLVPVHAQGPGLNSDFQILVQHEGGVWCYAGDKTS
jgi:hypothetical protein